MSPDEFINSLLAKKYKKPLNEDRQNNENLFFIKIII